MSLPRLFFFKLKNITIIHDVKLCKFKHWSCQQRHDQLSKKKIRGWAEQCLFDMKKKITWCNNNLFSFDCVKKKNTFVLTIGVDWKRKEIHILIPACKKEKKI